MLLTLCYLLVTCYAFICYAEQYDYSASIDCLPEPLPPQYNGGLIGNPTFDSAKPDPWTPFGDVNVVAKKSKTGNNYLTAFHRKKETDNFVFFTDIKNNTVYTFSAWIQVGTVEETVSAFYTVVGNNRTAMIGSVVAKSDCWSFLKGGFTAEEDERARFYFSTNNIDAEVRVDSVSLKAFTKSEWEAHQNQTIDQLRKRTIRIRVVNRDGKVLPGASIAVDQTRPKFLIGSGSPESIITSKGYQDYFASRFTAVTFHNEMKWYFTEQASGVENYTVPDAMVAFFKKNRISIRGHNILWADTRLNQDWVKEMQPRDILRAAVRRVGSVVSRYSGDIIGWDVMNENLHNSFFEEKLGPNASAMFFQIAHALDPDTPMFLNEYNVFELPTDMAVIPSKYVNKLRETRSFPGNENLTVYIGIQGHFLQKPMLSYIRATLDILGTTKMPIWITELDTRRGPLQAAELEEVMREVYSHPAVEGMIVWGGWKPTNCNETCLTNPDYEHLAVGCSEMCLVDNDFRNLPTGDVVDKLLKEWKTTGVKGVTDAAGVFEQNVFLGDYSITFAHPSIPSSGSMTFNVAAGDGPFNLYVYIP